MEQKIFERKIFFLFPPMGILDDVMHAVMENEYESYIISDPGICKAVLRKFPHSILFINIDSGLREPEWAQWILRIMVDPQLLDVQIGVFSARKDEELRRRYIMDIGVQCGYIQLRAGFSSMLSTILSVLAVVEAKGRRRYIRVSCPPTGNCKLNIRYSDTEYLTGQILDVSVVGFSCTFKKIMNWEKNELVKDVQLILSGMLILTNAVYYASRKDDNNSIPIYVFLFPQADIIANSSKIRSYLSRILQLRMDKILQETADEEQRKNRSGKNNESLPEIPIIQYSEDELNIEDFGELQPIDI